MAGKKNEKPEKDVVDLMGDLEESLEGARAQRAGDDTEENDDPTTQVSHDDAVGFDPDAEGLDPDVDVVVVEPARPVKKKGRSPRVAEPKVRARPKRKPKAAYPPVYAGDRVRIDGEEFIVAAVHGQGRVSLEGDERPPELWNPSEYELVPGGHADRAKEAADG